MKNSSQLCSVSELNTLLKQQSVRVLDCSWYLPSQKIDAQGQFQQEHIVGAQFFHIDEVCDNNSDLPHMLPSDEDFSKVASQFGISNNSKVVVYDSSGLFSAARVWWMFKVFGHQDVRVLDGGLPAWKEANGPMSSAITNYDTTDYQAKLNASAVVNKFDIIENSDKKSFTILDARSEGRFNGTEVEPRKGLPSGNMPESVSLPFNQLVDDGRLKPVNQLSDIFKQLNITQVTPLATSCGSGVTAAIITLALVECGYGLQRLYDGAWTDWASSDDTTILNRRIFDD